MTANRKLSPLVARLAELEISPAELAAICGVDVATVEGWITDGPDAEAKILLRPIFASDAAAAAAVERVRRPPSQAGGAYAPINHIGAGGYA